MSIHFVTGKPGGGKSLYSVMMLIDELRLTKRDIVTNLSLRIPRLCEYLHETYGETFDAHNRITLLDESQCFNFWLYRGRGVKIEGRRIIEIQDGEKKGRKRDVPDFLGHAHEMGSVFYEIDEVHKFFGARQWAENGNDAFYYLSEHRKFGDDVACVTQHIGNVDKQFRSIAQDYTYLRNHYKERIGRFTSLQCFSRKTYAEPYNGQGGQLCMESKKFKIDVAGICSCYDTAAGVGIIGRTGADTGHKAKGIPLKIGLAALAVGIVMVPIGIFAVCRMMTNGLTRAFKVNPPPMVVTNRPGEIYGRGMLVPQQNLPAARRTNSPLAGVPLPSFSDEPPLCVSGALTLFGRSEAYLSDGSHIYVGDGHCTAIGRNGAMVDGELVPMARPARHERKRDLLDGVQAEPMVARHEEKALPEIDLSSRKRLRIHLDDGTVIEKAVPPPSENVWIDASSGEVLPSAMTSSLQPFSMGVRTTGQPANSQGQVKAWAVP